MNSESLHVLLVRDDTTALSGLAQALEASCCVVELCGLGCAIAGAVAAISPDVIVVDPSAARSDSLEAILSPAAKRYPVVLFADEFDAARMNRAIAEGIAGYVANGAQPERLRSVLETAIARYRTQRALQNELSSAKAILAERKVLDRAKGLLMEKRGVSEGDAYGLLRKMAMDQNMRLVDVGKRVIEMAKLL